MDFLDPKKRRSHRIKLFIGYGLMTIVLLLTSIILLYQSYGYDYDSKTGQIVRNGLVFVDAKPSGSQVYLNGEDQGRVDKRLDVPSGEYKLELKKDGYRTWSRDFSLEGGKIEQFVYPLLFPAKLQTSDVQTYKSRPGLVTQSPDRRLILVQQAGSIKRFNLVDISGDKAEARVVTLPNGLMTGGSGHKLSLVEWSDDNRRLVVKHSYSGGTEFCLIDVESPSDSANLTEKFDTTFTSLALRGKNYDQYYLYNASSQTLRTANLDNPAASRYQSGVLAFSAFSSNEVAYITKSGASSGKVALKVREGADSYLVSEVDASKKYLLNLSRFDNSWYVTVGASANNKAYLFKNPVAAIKRAGDRQPLPVAILRTPKAIETISASANARFLSAQSGQDFAVYDAETDRQYRYDIKTSLSDGQAASWLDGHRLAIVSGRQAAIFDYDGTNLQRLNSTLSGSVPMVDNDYKALYSLSTSAKTKLPALVRTEL